MDGSGFQAMLGLALGLALLACGPAQAQARAPGLWEVQQKMQGPAGSGAGADLAQLQESMKQLPPEVRQMMERQMAAQGVGLGQGGALRICVSPEEASADAVREGQTEGDCTFTQVRRSGSVWRGQMACRDGARGSFVSTLHSARHTSTESVLDHPEMGRIRMTSEARWVASDCGALARRGAGAPKAGGR